MKKLIDANVILRYLLNDDAEKFVVAKQAIEDGAYTLPILFAEVVYVLLKLYKVDRETIANKLIRLLDTIDIDDKNVYISALTIFKTESLDFSDCVIVAYNKIKKSQVLTFDTKLSKILHYK